MKFIINIKSDIVQYIITDITDLFFLTIPKSYNDITLQLYATQLVILLYRKATLTHYNLLGNFLYI